MSLLRLLTSGKCLVGLRNNESRYRLPGDKSLPRFGSKKNPFRATVFPDKTGPVSEENPAEKAPAQCSGEEQKHEPAQESNETQQHKLSCAVAGQQAEQPSAPGKTEVAQPPRKSALKALLLWARAKRTISGARPLIQGELSLDKVKVVRNDLSESDLEVVRAGSAKSPGAAGARQAETPLTVAEPGWGSAAGQLAEAGKT